MINTEEFTERLQKVLDHYHLSASAFADKIQVNRASISHLMSGRNKPSLDFILKILDAFPEVELYWLLNGRGNFPKKPETTNANTLFSHVDVETDPDQKENQGKTFTDEPFQQLPPMDKKIEKIIIFYSDGTFKTFIES